MELSKSLADSWLSMYAIHMLELCLFVTLVWLIDKVLKLETRLRYLLWNLAVFKIFVPPVVSMPFSVQGDFPNEIAIFAMVRGIQITGMSGNAVSASQILLLLWLVSVLFLTLFIVYKNVVLGIRLGQAKPIQLSAVNRSSQHLPDSLQIFETDRVISPTLFGLWKPGIFLPKGWEAWPSKQLQSILIHESAHIKGRDLWIVALQYLALILFAVNPFVWLIHKRLNHTRELCCDEAALRETNISPVEYGKFILQFVSKRPATTEPMLIGRCFSSKNKTILTRLNHILNFKEVKMKTHASHIRFLVNSVGGSDDRIFLEL